MSDSSSERWGPRKPLPRPPPRTSSVNRPPAPSHAFRGRAQSEHPLADEVVVSRSPPSSPPLSPSLHQLYHPYLARAGDPTLQSYGSGLDQSVFWDQEERIAASDSTASLFTPQERRLARAPPVSLQIDVDPRRTPQRRSSRLPAAGVTSSSSNYHTSPIEHFNMTSFASPTSPTPLSPPPTYSSPQLPGARKMPASSSADSWRYSDSSTSPSAAITPIEEKSHYFGTKGLLPHLEGGSGQAKQRKRKWFWLAAIGGTIVVAVVAGGVAGALVSKNNKDKVVGSLSGAEITSSVISAEPSTSLRPAPSGISSAPVAAASVAKSSLLPGFSATLSSATVVVPIPVATPSSTARRLVVFGASWCDNGHARPSKYSASLQSWPYFEGRESNGIVWDEYLASSLGADLRNYAFSGAMVDNSLSTASVPDVKTQIASYLADVQSGVAPNLPSGGRTLIAIWIGLNSIMATSATAVRSNPSLPSSVVNTANSAIDANVASLMTTLTSLRTKLAASGTVADFMVLPLPPTEDLPYAIYTAKGSAAQLSLFKTLTETYNAGIATGLQAFSDTATSKMLSFDVTSLYRSMMSNPAQVPGVSDVTTACVLGNNPCSNPLSHFWWDSIHMTTDAHKYVAQKFQGAIQALWK